VTHSGDIARAAARFVVHLPKDSEFTLLVLKGQLLVEESFVTSLIAAQPLRETKDREDEVLGTHACGAELLSKQIIAQATQNRTARHRWPRRSTRRSS
jgi:hypothetical protein